MSKIQNKELLELAKELDQMDKEVTKFEADVLETILRTQRVSLKQENILRQMETDYLDE